ncbi:MAG: endonuclease/exonuclease/phosphatase family protein [Dactylosporangium sp.]|nr:endonuclease/exonuclease/phosphatase family protein [Dactylosporangium sp.]NNJ62180.1 endonuclease/exonuclease/phosphatase family protein [Dactylosporangium sp.]
MDHRSPAAVDDAADRTPLAPPRAIAPTALGRSGRWRLADLATWLPVLAVAAWAGARAFGLEGGTRPVQLMAFTPYVALAALVPLAVALLRRRWLAAGIAILATATLAIGVLPRSIPGATGFDPAPDGPTLRVMTSNVFAGKADAEALVGLIRRHQVDVLAVQELTAEGQRALAGAGLDTLLPNQMVRPGLGAAGTGVYTRLTIRRGSPRPLAASGFVQTTVTVAVPGAPDIEVESTHPCAPYAAGKGTIWRSDLSQQPAATPDGPLRVLLGDFNATLDHALLRELIATGYHDAAAVAGKGLVPTWPNDGQLIPGVTLDHVLADRRIGVRDVTIADVPGSDHRAVFAELVLPSILADARGNSG